MRAVITAALVLLTQSGCAPNATTYYRPAMDGGRVLAKHCVPTESIVEFGTLPFQASVIEGQNAWYVVLGLPAKKPPQLTWRTFHFGASNFRTRDPVSGITTSELSISVLRDDKSESVVEPYSPTRPGAWLYSIDVKLPSPPPDKFELLIPPVVLDGKEIQFPPIHFERKLWVGISAFNC